MPEEPKEHVLREPIPWRTVAETLTECGLPSSSYPTITLDEMKEKVKRQGQQRAAMSSCMSCWTAASRNVRRGEEEDPILAVIVRAVGRDHWRETPGSIRLSREFRAMAMLAERHREEFDVLVVEMEGATNLDKYRREKREKGIR